MFTQRNWKGVCCHMCYFIEELEHANWLKLHGTMFVTHMMLHVTALKF